MSCGYTPRVIVAADEALDVRLDQLLLERIRFGCIAMVFGLGVLTLISLSAAQWLVAASSGAAQLGAVVAWWLITKGRIHGRHAGALSFGLWLAAEVTVLVGFVAWRSTTQEIWLAVLLWGYGAMQLKIRWATTALIVGALAWLAMVWLMGVPSPALHIVSISASVAMGALAFFANVAVVKNLEVLRARELTQRNELGKALVTAEQALTERKLLEAERESLREQLAASQRMEAIGALAGGIAHNMNNVLAGILGIAKLRRETATGEEAEDLDMIVASAQRGAALTRSLIAFSRRAQYHKEPLALAEIATEVFSLLERTAQKGVSLELAVESDVYVDGDRTHLVHALLNLCINATQAVGTNGHIKVGIGRTTLSAREATTLGLTPGEWAMFSVEDDGRGMEPSVLRHAFDPFFTTRADGEASGLGLSMVWGTIKNHGGTTTLASTPGRGTLVECYLPRIAPPALKHEAARPGAANAVASMNLLVVDDDPSVRRTLTRTLQRAGHVVESAVDGVDALERFRAEPDRFEAVILDMQMPRMSGSECYAELTKLRPGLPVVCVSGYALEDQNRAMIGANVVFVPKPLEPRELYHALGRAVAGNALG